MPLEPLYRGGADGCCFFFHHHVILYPASCDSIDGLLFYRRVKGRMVRDVVESITWLLITYPNGRIDRYFVRRLLSRN